MTLSPQKYIHSSLLLKSKIWSSPEKKEFANLNNIEEKINMEKDIFDRGISYKKVQIDNSFPEYIVDNKEKFKEWII